MLFFAYETLKGSEELVSKCSHARDGIGIWKCWFIKERRRREKPLGVTAIILTIIIIIIIIIITYN